MLPVEAKTNGRYEFVIGKSPEYAENFENNYFDFIYIDGDHLYESVIADLKGWWPKLKDGGIMAGDDYVFVLNPAEGQYGVVEAVEEFAFGLQLIVNVEFNEKITVDPMKKHTIATKVGEELGRTFNATQPLVLTTPIHDGIQIHLLHYSNNSVSHQPPTWWIQK